MEILFCCPLILDLCQQSVLICIAGNLETYRRVASKLKLGTSEDEYTENVSSVLIKSPQSTGDTDVTGQVKTGEQHELVCVPIWIAVFFPLLLWKISCLHPPFFLIIFPCFSINSWWIF